MKKLILIAFLWLTHTSADACSNGALRITYENTPAGMMFKVKYIRDCCVTNTPYSIQLCFTSASNCAPSFSVWIPMDSSTSLIPVPIYSCGGTGVSCCNGGPAYGFDENNYKGLVYVPACNDWTVSTAICCRHDLITNLVDPYFNATKVETNFDNLNYPTNSSPEFYSTTINHYCTGVPYTVDYSAYDVDGDSLSYEFVGALSGNCNTTYSIPYASGFTYDQPLATTAPIVLNAQTGIFSFTASGPQMSVIAFRVNEYRNGQLIGSIRRDEAFVVVPNIAPATPDTIAGRVYFDNNANGLFDGGDVPVSSLQVHMDFVNMNTTTDATGKYFFQAGAGGYVIGLPNPPPYVTWWPLMNYVNTAGTGLYYDNNDFALVPAPNMDDLTVRINNVVSPVPGNSFPITVNYRNQGTTNQSNVNVDVVLDPSVQFDSSVPAPNAINGNTYSWNFAALNPLSGGSISILSDIDPAAVVGSTISSTATITSGVPDLTAGNNISSIVQTVVASFNPNSMQVAPEGDLPLSFVTSQQWINYRINFQNPGASLVQYVQIDDVLDMDLDSASFEFTGSSAPCVIISEPLNQFKFNFYGIYLPAASVDEPASHGYVEFRVKPKSTLTPGTFITNIARITFNINTQIFTNQVVNKVVVSTGVDTPVDAHTSFQLVPNPANDHTTLICESDAAYNATVIVYNITGKEVSSKGLQLIHGINTLELDTEKLDAGVYFIQLNYGLRKETRKLVVY